MSLLTCKLKRIMFYYNTILNPQINSKFALESPPLQKLFVKIPYILHTYFEIQLLTILSSPYHKPARVYLQDNKISTWSEDV